MADTMVPRRRWTLFIGGGIVASSVVLGTAARLTAPLGKPSALQVASLAVAVLLEVIAIGWVSMRLRSANERRRTLWIMIVVRAHFVLMGPAFGPLFVVLERCRSRMPSRGSAWQRRRG